MVTKVEKLGKTLLKNGQEKFVVVLNLEFNNVPDAQEVMDSLHAEFAYLSDKAPTFSVQKITL